MKSQTRLSDFTLNFHFHALEKERQPTPVFLPGDSQGWGSLGGLPSMGSHRVRQSDSAAAAAAVLTVHGHLAKMVIVNESASIRLMNQDQV